MVIEPAPLLAKGAQADFVFGDDRPFAQCHASTLTDTESGDLLCAWFGGTEESKPDVAIWMARFSNGQWSAPWRVAKVNETAHWNPVLFRDPRSGIHLFFKVGPVIAYWQTYWMTSVDDGQTWSAPVELVPGDQGGRGPVKNKPILLADGAWLAGASTELHRWEPFADRSEDFGATWRRSENFALELEETGVNRPGGESWKAPANLVETPPASGAIQPTLWEWKPGHIRAMLRTTRRVIGVTDSSDGGRTWAPVRPSGLPNNNSGIDALRLEDGRVLLVYNPVAKNWGARSPLNLAVSHDNGDTWRDVASLESEPGMEFSYPAIVRTQDGIAISYTWKRQRVRAWRIPLEALEGL